MLLVYDTDNVLHITNDKGLRWNYDKTQKPQFGFEYDCLFYNPFENKEKYSKRILFLLLFDIIKGKFPSILFARKIFPLSFI